MKAESDMKPKKYVIENKLNNECDIIFNTNIAEIEVETEIGIEKQYQYDTYRMKTKYRDNLEQVLEEKTEYDKWLKIAQETEYNELAKVIRNKRDKLLNDTDWTQMKDTSLSEDKVLKYQRYRQALRDIPEQEGFPYDVKFPKLEEM